MNLTPDATPVSLEQLIAQAMELRSQLPLSCEAWMNQIAELADRLAKGKLRFAVLGQFNRGKSTFLNALIGAPILPTSVLPTTAIPTVITYGLSFKCTITFLGNTAPKVATELQDITKLLIQFATEEANPLNKFGVASVTIESPTRLLANGTVFIDTPGFGSTHVHNTKTSIDILKECDAAFFMLSAELPITHAETEFIKAAKQFVSHFYFIINKVDLLSAADLKSTSDFTQGILTGTLGFAPSTQLYPISARQAFSASSQDSNDPLWQRSGMDRVMTEAVNFMAYEKYFTLSHALIAKFKEALGHVVESLSGEKAALCAPLDAMREEIAALESVRGAVDARLQKELALVEHEKKALLDFVRNRADVRAQSLCVAIAAQVETFVTGSKNVRNFQQQILAALPPLLSESMDHFVTGLAADCQRPLRNAAAAHRREYLAVATQAVKNAPHIVAAADDVIDPDFELFFEPPVIAHDDVMPFLTQIRLSRGFADMFSRARNSPDYWRKIAGDACNRYIDSQRIVSLRSFEPAINSLFDLFCQSMREPYTAIFQQIDESLAARRSSLARSEESFAIDLGRLESLLQKSGAILSQLS